MNSNFKLIFFSGTKDLYQHFILVQKKLYFFGNFSVVQGLVQNIFT